MGKHIGRGWCAGVKGRVKIFVGVVTATALKLQALKLHAFGSAVRVYELQGGTYRLPLP
jgi:hypothetical protein